jgi:hypothetical protein
MKLKSGTVKGVLIINISHISYQFVFCYVLSPHSHPTNLNNQYRLQLPLSPAR